MLAFKSAKDEPLIDMSLADNRPCILLGSFPKPASLPSMTLLVKEGVIFPTPRAYCKAVASAELKTLSPTL